MLETITISHLPFTLWYWDDVNDYGVSGHVLKFAKQAGVVGVGCAKDVEGKNVQLFVFDNGTVQVRAFTSTGIHPWERSKRLKISPLLKQLLHTSLTFKPGDWLMDFHAACDTEPPTGFVSYVFPSPRPRLEDALSPAVVRLVGQGAEAAILHLIK